MCEPDWRRLLCDGDRGFWRAGSRAILQEGTPCYHGISIDYIVEGSTIVVHGLHVSLCCGGAALALRTPELRRAGQAPRWRAFSVYFSLFYR